MAPLPAGETAPVEAGHAALTRRNASAGSGFEGPAPAELIEKVL